MYACMHTHTHTLANFCIFVFMKDLCVLIISLWCACYLHGLFLFTVCCMCILHVCVCVCICDHVCALPCVYGVCVHVYAFGLSTVCAPNPFLIYSLCLIYISLDMCNGFLVLCGITVNINTYTISLYHYNMYIVAFIVPITGHYMSIICMCACISVGL